METGKLKGAYEAVEMPGQIKEKGMQEPSLVLFINQFEKQVSRMNGYAEKIKERLNFIEEFEVLDGIPMRNDIDQGSLVERLRDLLDRMEYYNSKLENCSNHLNQII